MYFIFCIVFAYFKLFRQARVFYAHCNIFFYQQRRGPIEVHGYIALKSRPLTQSVYSNRSMPLNLIKSLAMTDEAPKAKFVIKRRSPYYLRLSEGAGISITAVAYDEKTTMFVKRL